MGFLRKWKRDLPPLTLLGATPTFAMGQFVVLTTISRTIGVDAAGEYSLALAVVTIAYTFLDFAMQRVYQSRVLDLSFAGFVAVRLAVSISGALPFVIFFLAYRSQFSILILTLVLARIGDQLGVLYTALQLNSQNRRRYAGTSQLLNGMLTSLFVVIALLQNPSLPLAGFASALASICAGAIYPAVSETRKHGFMNSFYEVKAEMKWRNIRSVSFTGMPLGLASLLTTMALSLPRFLLAAFDNMEAVGVFAMVSTVMSTAALPIQVVCQERLSRLSAAYKARDSRRYRDLARTTFVIGLLAWVTALLICWFCAPLFSQLLLGSELPQFIWALRVFVVLYFPVYLNFPMETIATSLGHFTKQLGSTIILCLIMVMLGPPAVASWGLFGVAITLAVAQSGRFGYLLYSIRKSVTRSSN